MFRDREEELQRLQDQLLEEEDPQPEEALPDDDDFDDLLSENQPIEDPEIYQNYSNDYGKNLRNYASGYRVYNSDKTDTDLDTYSESVREGQPSRRFLWIPVLLLGLLAAVVLALLWKYLRLGGIL
jgi:hypothetical protein